MRKPGIGILEKLDIVPACFVGATGRDVMGIGLGRGGVGGYLQRRAGTLPTVLPTGKKMWLIRVREFGRNW